MGTWIMKTIYVVVHCERDSSGSSDQFFSNLSDKSVEQTKELARKLKAENNKFDLIVSSPALITKTTSTIFANELKVGKKIMYNEVLYEGYLEELVESINLTYHSINNVIIVGHSGLLTSLVAHFIGHKDKIQYGEINKIEFDTDNWIDINFENAKLVKSITL